MDAFIPILTMGLLGLLFSIGLSLAYQKLKVEEDPKVEKINEILPQANCGACGYSGCRAFAEVVAQGKAEVSGCPVGGDDVSQKIAEIMGTDAGKAERKVARLHCRGDHQAAKDKGIYLGITTCYAAHIIGGNKQCVYGCLGYGDCVSACPFDAIEMGEEGLPEVDEAKCTACGKCVDACPRNLFELHPVSQNIMVFCRSLDSGAAAKKSCKNACISCGICVRACPEAIVLENNLAKIKDYKKISPEEIPAIEKCPTDAIGQIKKEETHEG
jgi:RnfABCDGE-type electron transport complex B subunit